jgi:uncharacterized damage-inducible protein DinB
MNAPACYDYLMRARRDLWTALAAMPDAVLARPVLDGERFHCIKDLVFHIASVEDGWVNEDIRRMPPVLDTMASLKDTPGGAAYADVDLAVLLDYWRAVEQQTESYLATVGDSEWSRVVTVHDAPDERYTADGLFWHVMLHEIRHTAQICMLLRQQGVTPPSLDLLFYLPRR